ncbi:MAG: hypothetical protein LUE16_00350 [Lachnospiraceae bacterium]|nr:hypothetical protein [Lachnospiraceae bacterium]
MNQNSADSNHIQQQTQHKTQQIPQTSLRSLSDEQESLSDKQESRSAGGGEHPAAWHCDTYCRKVRYVTCEGRAFADPSAPECCPYLEEMLY